MHDITGKRICALLEKKKKKKPRNRDKKQHADAETQATYLDAKDAYAVCQTCAKTLKFTMYITHVVSVCTFTVGLVS